MEKIKVVVIDVKAKTVTEREIEPKLPAYYAAIGCSMIEAVYVQGMKDHLLYVDEEGTFGAWEEGFQINGYPGVIYGNAVVLATDSMGNDRPCRFDADAVAMNVKFIDLPKQD